MRPSFSQRPRQKWRFRVQPWFLCVLGIVGVKTLLMSFFRSEYRELEETLQHELNEPIEVQKQRVDIARSLSDPKVSLNSSDGLALKCQDHPAWGQDAMWRNAILQPQLCISNRNIMMSTNEKAYRQEQLTLLHETSVSDFTPCGSHCIYHLDSAYSYHYGHPVYGWILRSDKRKLM
jgi:hypothetical protein